MGVFDMVFGIVLLGVIGGVIKHAIDRKYPEGKEAAMSDDTSRKMADLEDRVRTLERIVTDKGRQLSDEIDRL